MNSCIKQLMPELVDVTARNSERRRGRSTPTPWQLIPAINDHHRSMLSINDAPKYAPVRGLLLEAEALNQLFTNKASHVPAAIAQHKLAPHTFNHKFS